MQRMFQIQEEDLSTLEAALPRIADRLTCAPGLLDNPMKVQLRRVQSILSQIRWNYGPPSEVIIIPAGGPEDQAR